MTETVSQFKERCKQLKVRKGIAYYNTMRFSDDPAQALWACKIIHSRIDSSREDRRIPAFLAAAVAAGVLRDG